MEKVGDWDVVRKEAAIEGKVRLLDSWKNQEVTGCYRRGGERSDVLLKGGGILSTGKRKTEQAWDDSFPERKTEEKNGCWRTWKNGRDERG